MSKYGIRLVPQGIIPRDLRLGVRMQRAAAFATTGETTFDDTCPPLLTACQADLATCQADLATCDASLATCTTDLATCNTNLATCNTNLATCTSSLATCQSALTSCQSSLATYQNAYFAALFQLVLTPGPSSTYSIANNVANGVSRQGGKLHEYDDGIAPIGSFVPFWVSALNIPFNTQVVTITVTSSANGLYYPSQPSLTGTFTFTGNGTSRLMAKFYAQFAVASGQTRTLTVSSVGYTSASATLTMAA